jgi:hypothetical protein
MQYKGVAFHYGSLSIQSNQNKALGIIEAAKVAWANLTPEDFKCKHYFSHLMFPVQNK